MADDFSWTQARREAQTIIDRERFESLVVAEVARLRELRSRRTLWQRLLDALPFTLTWKK